MPVLSGRHESGAILVIADMGVRAFRQQYPASFHLSSAGSQNKWRLSIGILRVRIGSLAKQQTEIREILILSGRKQVRKRTDEHDLTGGSAECVRVVAPLYQSYGVALDARRLHPPKG